jgi:hypothetical protein
MSTEYSIKVTYTNANGEFEGDEEIVEFHDVFAPSQEIALFKLGALLATQTAEVVSNLVAYETATRSVASIKVVGGREHN